MPFRDVEREMISQKSQPVTADAEENGRVFKAGVNIVGICATCKKEVFCCRGSRCSGFEEFPCPRKGCDGYIEEPTDAIFFNCAFKVKYNKKVGGKYTGIKTTTERKVPPGEYMSWHEKEVQFSTYHTLEFHTS